MGSQLSRVYEFGRASESEEMSLACRRFPWDSLWFGAAVWTDHTQIMKAVYHHTAPSYTPLYEHFHVFFFYSLPPQINKINFLQIGGLPRLKNKTDGDREEFLMNEVLLFFLRNCHAHRVTGKCFIPATTSLVSELVNLVYSGHQSLVKHD